MLYVYYSVTVGWVWAYCNCGLQLAFTISLMWTAYISPIENIDVIPMIVFRVSENECGIQWTLQEVCV